MCANGKQNEAKPPLRGPRWGLLMGHIFLLPVKCYTAEVLVLTVIYEITVKCDNTFWILIQ